MNKKLKWGCGCGTAVLVLLAITVAVVMNEMDKSLHGGVRHRATVDGITYTFRVEKGVARLSPGKFWEYPIDTNTVGALNIPSKLGKYPLKRIGRWSFVGYCGLTSVVIPDSVESVGGYAFRECSSLRTVVLPNTITYLPPYLFESCVSLADITIPDSVTNLYSGVFAKCTSLTSVTIPKSVTNLDNPSEIFKGCSSLTSIVVDADNPNYSSIDGVLFDKSGTRLLVCPAGKQGAYAVPNAVVKIETEAFAGCSELLEVSVSAHITIAGSITNVVRHPVQGK